MYDCVIYDVYNIVFRAYYAHAGNPLSTNAGVNSAAVFGSTLMLMNLRSLYPSKYALAATEGGKTYRHEAYPLYKAGRKSMPDELRDQIPTVFDMFTALGIPVFSFTGYEADDVIGTVSTLLNKANKRVLLVSGDKDMLQLIKDNVHVLLLKPGGIKAAVRYDINSFMREKGYHPTKLIDIKALSGDKSDNIPGLPRVGEKTAEDWIKKYGTIRGIYENIKDLPKSKQQLLKEEFQNLVLYRKLVKIQTDIQTGLKLKDLLVGNLDETTVYSICQEYQMTSLLGRISSKLAKKVEVSLF